jgi:hypothetical protein
LLIPQKDILKSTNNAPKGKKINSEKSYKIDLVCDGRSYHHQGLVDQVTVHLDKFAFASILELIFLKLGQSLGVVQPVDKIL